MSEDLCNNFLSGIGKDEKHARPFIYFINLHEVANLRSRACNKFKFFNYNHLYRLRRLTNSN